MVRNMKKKTKKREKRAKTSIPFGKAKKIFLLYMLLFESFQKKFKKPLTSLPVCGIMSLPLQKGFFFVPIFRHRIASHSATRTRA